MLLNIMNSLGDQRSIIITVFAYAVILLIAIPIHECSHCFAAYLMGDDTGLYSGRITLNPIKHWDLWGTIGMLTVGIGWGKPAPVNPVRARKVSARTQRNRTHPRRGLRRQDLYQMLYSRTFLYLSESLYGSYSVLQIPK